MKYSVIMPIYNSEKKLDRSIKSVIEQTCMDWELLLIDDGSTDNSLSICKKYARMDRRIKVFHQENKGPGSARNLGIQECKGEYITFIDSDDYYEKDYFETLNNANKTNDFDLLFFGLVLERENGEIYKYNHIGKFKKYDKEQLIKLQLMGILSWGSCLKAMKSSIAKACTFSDLQVGEELLFSFNVLKRAKKIEFIDKVLYHYVYNDTGQHTKGGCDPWHDVVINMKKYLIEQKQYKKYEQSINGLALRSLSISIYRYSSKLKYKEAIFKIKESIRNYKKEYNIKNVEFSLLDKFSRIILLLINLKLHFLLYIASKIKDKKN